MRSERLRYSLFLMLAMSPCAVASQQNAAPGFPADSGALNVRDYGALGDGRHDDTASILRAIAAAGPNTDRSVWQDGVVYFPDGTYLISAPLVRRYADGKFASGMTLIGQSEGKTILKLKDRAEGYGDAAHPRAMIFTSSKLQDRSGPYGGGKNYPDLGEGNDAYRNGIECMTVDAGEGNSGAIAIDYLASNVGAIRHVTVRAGAASGAVGVAMTRKYIGPALLDHVTIEGFAIGIDVANVLYGVTLDHIRIRRSGMGLRNSGNEISVNAMEIHSDGPAIASLLTDGEIVLAESTLDSKANKTIDNQAGVIVFHHTTATHTENLPAGAKSGASLDGYLSGTSAWTPISPKEFVSLVDAPQVVEEPLKKWVSVTRFGAKAIPFTDVPEAVGVPIVDSYPAFVKAFGSGASTIYIPHGTYYLSKNLVIPSTVRRVVGMDSTISVYRTDGYQMTREQGAFRILSVDKSATPLSIEHLAFYNKNGGPQWGLEYASNRPLLVRDTFFSGMAMMHRLPSGGTLYLSDTNSGGNNVLRGNSPLHAVQLNMEGCNVCLTSSDGADLNVLGLKTETDVTALDITGGRSQVVGGLLYIVRKKPDPQKPAFRTTDAALSASFVEVSFEPETTYKYYLADIWQGKTTLLEEEKFPKRNQKNDSRLVPWLQTPEHASASAGK